MFKNPGAPNDWEHSHPAGVWTNSDGKATFTLRFYDAGQHDIEVAVLNRATREASLTTEFIDRVEVPKPHSITPEDAPAKYVEELENYRDTFIVESVDGQALEGFQVKISAANVSDTVFTDNEGKATGNLRMSFAGTYDVHVTVHDYWGSKVWLQKTFPNRISVGSQCDKVSTCGMRTLDNRKVRLSSRIPHRLKALHSVLMDTRFSWQPAAVMVKLSMCGTSAQTNSQKP